MGNGAMAKGPKLPRPSSDSTIPDLQQASENVCLLGKSSHQNKKTVISACDPERT